MSFLTKENLKVRCRTCLRLLNESTDIGASQSNTDEVTQSNNSHFKLANEPELQQLISINVDNSSTSDLLNGVINEYPENVCLSCYKTLYSFASFRRRAQQSAEKLHLVLICRGDIKVEINFDEYEDEPSRNDLVEVTTLPVRRLQLNDASAGENETSSRAPVDNLVDAELNDNTIERNSLLPSLVTDTKSNDDTVVSYAVLPSPPYDDIRKAKEFVLKYEQMKKNKYKCSQCKQGFPTTNQIKEHVKQVHPMGNRPFYCDYCPSTHRHHTNLQAHIQNKHQDKIKEQKIHFQCTECPKVFLDYRSRKHHIDLHFSKNKTHVCEICNERFPTKTWLIEHLRTHTADGKIPCSKCPKAYTTIESLESHVYGVHLKAKPYYCEICGKSYQTRHSFQLHGYIHTGEKHYLCDICGVDFAQSSSLRRHHLKCHKTDANN